MRIPAAFALALSVSALVPAAPAQAQVEVTVTLPVIRFETAPALVYVSPGVQVVPEYDEEVFYVRGFYWARHGGNWYRSSNHRGDWVYMRSGVPSNLRAMSPGKYRRYHHVEPARAPAPSRQERRHDNGGDRGKGHGKGGGNKHDKGRGR